jgi:hypothetical protein
VEVSSEITLHCLFIQFCSEADLRHLKVAHEVATVRTLLSCLSV